MTRGTRRGTTRGTTHRGGGDDGEGQGRQPSPTGVAIAGRRRTMSSRRKDVASHGVDDGSLWGPLKARPARAACLFVAGPSLASKASSVARPIARALEKANGQKVSAKRCPFFRFINRRRFAVLFVVAAEQPSSN